MFLQAGRERRVWIFRKDEKTGKGRRQRNCQKKNGVHHSWTPGNREAKWVINLVTYQIGSKLCYPQESHDQRAQGRAFRPFLSLFHLFMHSLVASCKCLDWGSTPTILVYQEAALTNWTTRPGPPFLFEQKQSPGDVLSKGKCLSQYLDVRKQ